MKGGRVAPSHNSNGAGKRRGRNGTMSEATTALIKMMLGAQEVEGGTTQINFNGPRGQPWKKTTLWITEDDVLMYENPPIINGEKNLDCTLDCCTRLSRGAGLKVLFSMIANTDDENIIESIEMPRAY